MTYCFILIGLLLNPILVYGTIYGDEVEGNLSITLFEKSGIIHYVSPTSLTVGTRHISFFSVHLYTQPHFKWEFLNKKFAYFLITIWRFAYCKTAIWSDLFWRSYMVVFLLKKKSFHEVYLSFRLKPVYQTKSPFHQNLFADETYFERIKTTYQKIMPSKLFQFFSSCI